MRGVKCKTDKLADKKERFVEENFIFAESLAKTTHFHHLNMILELLPIRAGVVSRTFRYSFSLSRTITMHPTKLTHVLQRTFVSRLFVIICTGIAKHRKRIQIVC